ncbi:MAG: hypothetical protein Q8P11_04305 [bacterium]|nr:hypothetical protein [bacterium]
MKRQNGDHKRLWIGFVSLVLASFFVLYSYLSWESVKMPLLRFNAPDEQANYFFAKYFADETKLSYSDPLLEVSQHFVHPRSMTASEGEVKPVGFLGFALIYGILAKIFSVSSLPFFTPFLAVLTTLFFYIALKKIFDKKIALVSSALLLIHPAYWYYSARAMMPNILFLDLFIIGVSLLVIASSPERKEKYIAVVKAVTKLQIVRNIFYLKTVLFFLGGFLVALALTVRLSEILWISVLIFLWGLLYIRRLTVWRVMAFIIGFFIPIAILFSYNYSLYGNILSSGYRLLDVTSSTNAVTRTVDLVQHGQLGGIIVSIKNIIRPFLPLLLPFGYHPEIFWGNAYNYLVTFFLWFTIPTLAGILLLLRNQVNTIMRHHVPHHLWYLILWVGLTFWLVIFYGSWKLTDNINGEVALGVSYVRYWLPSYVMALPFIAMLLVWLFEKGKGMLIRRTGVILGLGVLLILSARLVYLGGQESLTDVHTRLQEMQSKAQIVFDSTEENAVIFSDRSDKIFFPGRNVASSSHTFPENTLIVTLIEKAPVYYYGLWDEVAAQYASRTYFEPLGLRWEFMKNVAPKENLYRLTKIPIQ